MFCSDLKELETKIINYKEKEMISLTDNENRSYEKQKKKVTYVKKGFIMIKMKKRNLNYTKNLGDHCHYTGKFRGASHSICDLRYKVPQEIPVKIHNGSKYDYHFLIKELAEEFKSQFEWLGENTEKYITFSVPIKDDNGKTITYKIKFIDTCNSCQVNYQTCW